MNKQSNKKKPIHLIGVSGRIGSGKDLVGEIIQYISYCRNNKIAISYLGFEEFTNSIKVCEQWTIKKFADKLKDCTCLLLGCTRRILEHREYKETELGKEWWYYKAKDGKTPSGLFTLEDYAALPENQKEYLELVKLTPRLILQLLGTECGRLIIHPNVWVNALMAEYNTITMSYHNDILIGRPDECRGKICYYPGYNEKEVFPNWIITDLRFPNEANAIKAKDGILIRINRPNNTIETSGIQQHASETALDDYKFDYVVENDGTIEDLIFKIDKIV